MARRPAVLGPLPETARSQSEDAYLRIRERIVSLEMPPGSVVEESRLRDELELGRTPIREALQRLALENLVRSVPHRGTFVTADLSANEQRPRRQSEGVGIVASK